MKGSGNIIDNSNNETSFPYKLLLTGRQVLRLSKDFANNLSTNLKSSKAQLSRKVQSNQEDFLVDFLHHY